MQLFNLNQNQLSSLKEKSFKFEKDIQELFENNLEIISGLKLVKSEFIVKAQRLDTLAYDKDANSFVIIEYKRGRNFSVVDQGVSYLNLMLEYKADFIVEYNESIKSNLKRSDVDWSQSKVIFVSPSFTDFQKQASNFKDLPIELWEIKQYEGNIVVINPIKKSKAAPSIKGIQRDSDSRLEKVATEVKVYIEEDHLGGKSDDIIELYEAFKQSIFNLGNNIDVRPKKMEIGFTHEGKIFTDICILKSSLKLWINLKRGALDDPKSLARDVSSIGHWGNGDYEIIVKDTKDLEYIMSLVKQAI
jgi:predicted transport protein